MQRDSQSTVWSNHFRLGASTSIVANVFATYFSRAWWQVGWLTLVQPTLLTVLASPTRRTIARAIALAVTVMDTKVILSIADRSRLVLTVFTRIVDSIDSGFLAVTILVDLLHAIAIHDFLNDARCSVLAVSLSTACRHGIIVMAACGVRRPLFGRAC